MGRSPFATAGLLLTAGLATAAPTAPSSVASFDTACRRSPAVATGHILTPAAATQLRARIARYRTLSDQEIHAAMAAMPPDAWWPVSARSVSGSSGVLVLGHGYGTEGDCELANALAPLAARQPVALALGMAMTSSAHLQAAVSWLEAQGARSVVVLPVVSGQSLSLVRQWEHAFGRRREAAYADLPRVHAGVPLRWANPLVASPAFVDIATALTRPLALDPRASELVLLSHGPEADTDARRDGAQLAMHAKAVAERLGLAGGHAVLLQDDAPEPRRRATVADLRNLIAGIGQRNRVPLVVALPVARSTGWVDRQRAELRGLDYRFAAPGLVNTREFTVWAEASTR